MSAAITTAVRRISDNLGVAVLGSTITARTRAPGRPGLTTARHPVWWIRATGGLLITAIGLTATTARGTRQHPNLTARQLTATAPREVHTAHSPPRNPPR
ncbi:hypothetical protein [Streptomyces sp. NBC_00343]|uniref:hypothetical protein n=1 Tax=Streptomyces sp. NBC_00343 TaxID=2975719 RepID=UPI002E2D5955|nr:hypothetical protein [Streptomyces sp. NBC_00343]